MNRGYAKYLKSRHWIATRSKYWASVGGMKCMACGSKKPPLHVHHKTYERFGKELLTDLVGLCDTCHKKVHAQHRKNGGSLKFWTEKHIAVESRKRK